MRGFMAFRLHRNIKRRVKYYRFVVSAALLEPQSE